MSLVSKRSSPTNIAPAPAKRLDDASSKAKPSPETNGTVILQKNQILSGLPGAFPTSLGPISDTSIPPLSTVSVSTNAHNCLATNPPSALKPDPMISPLQNDLRDLSKLVQMRDLLLALSNHADTKDDSLLDLEDAQYHFNLIEGTYIFKNQKSLHEAREVPTFPSCCRIKAEFDASWKQMRHRIITTETHLKYIYENLFKQDFDLTRFGQWWGLNRKAEEHKIAIFELLGFANIRTEAGNSYYVLNFSRIYNSEEPTANLSTHFQLVIASLLQRLFCKPPGFGLDMATYLKEHLLTGPK